MNNRPFRAMSILQIIHKKRPDPAQFLYPSSDEQGLHCPSKVDYELQMLTKLFTRNGTKL